MTPHGIITFTTDFGTTDTFVAQMKGAALSVAPAVRLVDLCHEVPAQDVLAGSYLLESGFGAFPEGTIHVAVVDPGVGSDRRGLAIAAAGHVFVAPDNGLLSRVLDRAEEHRAFELQAEHYFRRPLSPTFEGRDRFAPAAAWIARGVGLEHFGPPAEDLVRLPASAEPVSGSTVDLRVIHVDRFGNLVLDVTAAALERAAAAAPGEGRLRVSTPAGNVVRFVRTYAEVDDTGAFLLINSAGYLEVAVREGSAAAQLGLRSRDEVALTLAE